MSEAINTETHRHRQAILWILRVTVALQCLGNWRWLTQVEETPLLHWLVNASDVGGLGWEESTALMSQQVLGWLVLLAGAIVLWRPLPAVLGIVVIQQILVSVAMWQNADGYPLQSQWLSPQLLTLFPFATRLGRIVAPLGLMLLVMRGKQSAEHRFRMQSVVTLFRGSMAVVFLTHGIEAWQHNPKFLDLLIGSSLKLFGLSLSQSVAEQILTVIGGLDIVLAILCLGLRWPSLFWWMAIWGGITAFSRVAAYGWNLGWHECFMRVPHIGVPLTVALWWHLLKYDSPAEPPAGSANNTPERAV